MAETRSTLQTFAPHVPVSVPLQAVSFVRAAFVNFVSENPLTWFWNQGRRNAQADMEGEQHHCMDRYIGAHHGQAHSTLSEPPTVTSSQAKPSLRHRRS